MRARVLLGLPAPVLASALEDERHVPDLAGDMIGGTWWARRGRMGGPGARGPSGS